MRTLARLVPRQRVQVEPLPGLHELVPRRMELDLVHALPEPVVRPQHRRVLVRQAAPLLRLAAPERAGLDGAIRSPAAALALQRLDQRRVVQEQVAVRQRRYLVEDLVGGAVRRRGDGHQAPR